MTSRPVHLHEPLWDDRQTRRVIAIRTVKPTHFDGSHEPLFWVPSCDERVSCGGRCALAPGHDGEHECGADAPGHPGSCPA